MELDLFCAQPSDPFLCCGQRGFSPRRSLLTWDNFYVINKRRNWSVLQAHRQRCNFGKNSWLVLSVMERLSGFVCKDNNLGNVWVMLHIFIGCKLSSSNDVFFACRLSWRNIFLYLINGIYSFGMNLAKGVGLKLLNPVSWLVLGWFVSTRVCWMEILHTKHLSSSNDFLECTVVDFTKISKLRQKFCQLKWYCSPN